MSPYLQFLMAALLDGVLMSFDKVTTNELRTLMGELFEEGYEVHTDLQFALDPADRLDMERYLHRNGWALGLCEQVLDDRRDPYGIELAVFDGRVEAMRHSRIEEIEFPELPF